jgi:hypothetical protein
MKITVKQFKRLIREVALSPSLKQNKPVDDPFQSKSVNVSLEKLQAAFEQTLAMDLIVRAMDEHYNEATREFDDVIYKQITSIVEDSKGQATAIVKKALQQAWDNAHHDSSGAQSGTRIKAASKVA